MRRPLILGIALTLLAGLGSWLVGSESGLHATLRLATWVTADRLQVDGASGRLLGPLRLNALRWQAAETHIRLENLQLDWSPAALLGGRLQIAALTVDHLQLQIPPSPQPPSVPSKLRLPLALDVQHWRIGRLAYNGIPIDDLAGRLSSDGQRHQLTDFHARTADVAINGHAQLAGDAPFTVDATLQLQGQLAERPLAASLDFTGPLAQITLNARATAGIDGTASVQFTPFARSPFSAARIALRNIDPAAWLASAPSAKVDFTAELQPADSALLGSFGLTNRQPATLERGGLPLATLAGQLHWHDEQLDLPVLHATLAGNGGELTGSAHWAAAALKLDLQAQRLNAARLHGTLRPTRLNGPLTVNADASQQMAQIDLKDPAFALRAQLSHAAGTVDLHRVELRAGDAQLLGQGQWHSSERRFKAAGELRRFDPSRFARLPAARINARLQADGQLAEQPQIQAEFALRDSQWAGLPFTGQGSLRLDGARLSAADLMLAAGDNRVRVNGAFGAPGDRLQIRLDARQLSPYGLSGGIHGQAELAGTAQHPSLSARFTAPRLGWPGQGEVRGLQLDAEIGAGDDSGFALDLTVDRVDSADRPRLLQQLQLQGSGLRRQHRLALAVRLTEAQELQLNSTGGLDGTRWRGQLQALRLQATDGQPLARLDGESPLSMAADGWQLGPLRLVLPRLDGRATLTAQADRRELQASAHIQGQKIGTVDGQLSARLENPWTLASAAPWQGSLQLDNAQLTPLGALLGEGWRTAGRLDGRLLLTGTPARPALNGQLRGRDLTLEQLDQGLVLNEGRLAVDLAERRLFLREARFTSIHHHLPAPLQNQLGAVETARLSAPGQLEISGEIDVDRIDDGRARLDVRLDRVGAWQLADQWVALSGTGQLSWQAGVLGIRGALTADAAWWQLAPAGAPSLSDDVVIRRAGKASAERPRPRLDLDLNADFGRNFLFSGAGLDSRLTGSIRLTAQGRDLPRASGSIRVRDGRYAAYGQQLEIERGVLTFQGLLDNPALDIRAQRKGLPVEPGVQIGGSAQRPVVRLVSDPEVPDAEKLAWLVLGHGGDRLGPGDATVLLSAAGGLLGNNAGGVVQQLKRTFGLDEFGVRQGSLDGSGGPAIGSRIAGGSTDTTALTGNQIFSVGKRLGSNALLSYEQSLGKAESIVKLSIDLTRGLSLVGRAGSENAIDLFYTFTWGRPSRPSPHPASP